MPEVSTSWAQRRLADAKFDLGLSCCAAVSYMVENLGVRPNTDLVAAQKAAKVACKAIQPSLHDCAFVIERLAKVATSNSHGSETDEVVDHIIANTPMWASLSHRALG